MTRKQFVSDIEKLLRAMELGGTPEVTNTELVKFREHVTDYVTCVLLVREQEARLLVERQKLDAARRPR